MNSNIKFLGVDSTKVDLTEKKDSTNNQVTEYYSAEEISGQAKSYTNYFDFSSGSITTISNINTWVKLNTNTTEGFSNNGLVHTNNRVTNTGPTKIFQVEGIASVSSSNNEQIHFAFFKNGVLWPCSEQEGIMGSGGKSNAIPFHCLIQLEPTNYVEVWVKNKNHTTNIVLDNINVIIKEL